MKLLPSDQYLCQVLGLTEEEFLWFKAEARKRAAEGPQPAVVAGLETAAIVAIAQLVVGTGLLVASQLLKPKAPQAGDQPGQPRRVDVTTDPIVRNDRFSPRYGFDSTQDVATLGSIVPIVYAKRETLGGTTYGGIRINMPMVWNQILSLGGGQMLRAVFLLSEGTIESLDAANFAIGSSTLQGYTFDSSAATETGGRATVYFNGDGGRIAGADRVAGRSNANDDGSASSSDVFQVFWDNSYQTDFCSTSRPASQTTFGVYSPIGNNLGYKVNPVIRPGVRTVFQNNTGDTRIKVMCPVDSPQMNLRDKYRARFATFSGIVGTGVETSVSVGDTITYKLFDDSDWLTEFDGYTDQSDSEAECKDIASTVASRQHTWDDSLVVGELYKIGSALAICTNRTQDVFTSEADLNGSSGTTIAATFSVVRGGAVTGFTEDYITAKNQINATALASGGSGYTTGTYTDVPLTGGTGSGATANITVNGSGVITSVSIVNAGAGYAATDSLSASDSDLGGGGGSGFDLTVSSVRTGGDAGRREVATTAGHIMRYASAYVSTNRPCEAVELGLKSALGIKVTGLCNFRDAKTYEFTDNKYCEAFENQEGDEIVNAFYQSGTISSPVQRYSFFKVKHKEVDDASWTTLTHAYGVRSETQQALFNYLRLEFADSKQREFMLEPLTGYEVRNNKFGGGATLYVLDQKLARVTIVENGATVVFNGESVTLNTDTFAINYGVGDPDLDSSYSYDEETNGGPTRTYQGLRLVDTTNYIDDYGKLAETFVYSEIASTAEGGPEHEIVYVGEIVSNDAAPLYDDLALVGLNIRSSAEWRQFSQFSAYVTGGRQVQRLTNSDSVGASHLFPDILRDLMLNERFGSGNLITADMLDEASFYEAAEFCESKYYFFDGAIAEPINIRQWAADTAATHLLIFGEANGKFFLRRAFPTGKAVISGLFTAGNIAEGSFKFEYFDPEDRDRIQVSVRYREERASTDASNPGLFPVMREVLVRESDDQGGDPTDPIEQLDLSAYCTSREHAIDAAKYMIRMRRIPTHAINFSTTHDGVMAELMPGDYIKVAMDETEYDEFNNGVVTSEGALVSTKTLADGTYDVIAWDGTEGKAPADNTLSVTNGGTRATPTGVVFTVKSPSTQMRVYQIEQISADDDGTFTIQAMHMPIDSDGILELAAGFDTATNWTIDNS